jgi:hypothetical protein
MTEHCSRMADKIIKWQSSIAKMIEFTVATRKWMSSLKWLSTKTKIAKHYSNDVAKWSTENSKITYALSKWLSESWKMTELREVGAVWGLSTWSGPRRLNQDAAWTTWRGVNVGQAGSNTCGCVGAGRESLARAGRRGARSPSLNNGPMDPSP